jgi:hypothetical protein
MKISIALASMLLLLSIVMSGCAAIGAIFKTGVVFGILLVVIVLAIILYIINRSSK